jgi:hypothetical protein
MILAGAAHLELVSRLESGDVWFSTTAIERSHKGFTCRVICADDLVVLRKTQAEPLTQWEDLAYPGCAFSGRIRLFGSSLACVSQMGGPRS